MIKLYFAEIREIISTSGTLGYQLIYFLGTKQRQESRYFYDTIGCNRAIEKIIGHYTMPHSSKLEITWTSDIPIEYLEILEFKKLRHL